MKLSVADAFAALELEPDAEPEVVRQRYRQLALRFHPDKNGDAGATAAFQRVSAAYKRICDHRERLQKRQRNGSSARNGGLFFDGIDSDGEDEELREDELEVSLEEMLAMFHVLFGMSTISKPARNGHGRPGREAQTQGVSVNVGGRRRGRRKAKAAQAKFPGKMRVDDDMEVFLREMVGTCGFPGGECGSLDEFDGCVGLVSGVCVRLVQHSCFAWRSCRFDGEDDYDAMMAMASVFMGFEAGMQDMKGRDAWASEEDADGDVSEADACATPSAEAAKSSRQAEPPSLALDAAVTVFGRLPGVRHSSSDY